MNVWLLQTGEIHPFQDGARKMRTAMLADNLHARGHSIAWWSTNFCHQKKALLCPDYEEVNIASDYVIKLIKGLPYSRNVDLRRYIHHKLIANRFKQLSKGESPPDVIVASMPDYDLAYEAVCFARNNCIPVFVDIRDLWPDIFVDQILKRVRNIARWFLSHDSKKLRILLGNADALIAVSEGYLEWALDKAGRLRNEWDRVFFLGYMGKHDAVTSAGSGGFASPGWVKERKDQKLMVFIGTFGTSYELKLILEAAHKMQADGRKDVCFVLAGDGEQAESIQREAAGLRDVVLPGWINAEGIRGLLQNAYVGLVPCRSIENTIPNKPFEYLSAGLPLISSLEGEMADLIEKYRLGLNYRAGHLASLCYCIERLLDNPDLREEMSANALKFFREYGDAERIYTDYAEHIECLVEARRGKAKAYQGETSF